MGQKIRIEAQIIPEFQNWIVCNADVDLATEKKAQLCGVIPLEQQIPWLH